MFPPQKQPRAAINTKVVVATIIVLLTIVGGLVGLIIHFNDHNDKQPAINLPKFEDGPHKWSSSSSALESSSAISNQYQMPQREEQNDAHDSSVESNTSTSFDSFPPSEHLQQPHSSSPHRNSHFLQPSEHDNQSPQLVSRHSPKFTKHVSAYRHPNHCAGNVHPDFRSTNLEFFNIRGDKTQLPNNLIEHLQLYPIIDHFGRTLRWPGGILQYYKSPTIFLHGTAGFYPEGKLGAGKTGAEPWDFMPEIQKELWLIALTQQNQRNLYWPLADHCAGDNGWIIVFQLIGEETVDIREFDCKTVPWECRFSTTLIGRTGYGQYYPTELEYSNGFDKWKHPDAYICTKSCMKQKMGKWKMLRAYKRIH